MNRLRRMYATLALAGCALVAHAPHSLGATFQVASPGQPGNNTTCAPCSTIKGALAATQLSPGTDTIQLGAGAYIERVDIPLSNPVNLIGAGASGSEATTLSAPTDVPIVSIAAGSVRDLHVVGLNHGTVVRMTGGILQRVSVTEIISSSSVNGVEIRNGGLGTPTIVDSSIYMASAGSGWASWGVSLYSYNARVNIFNTSITADFVLDQSQGGYINARRMNAVGRNHILNDGEGGVTEIRNSLMRLSSGYTGFKLFPHDAPNRVSRLKLYNSTLVGTGQEASTAFALFAENNNSAHLLVRDSVIHKFGTHLSATESGLGAATADVRYSLFNQRKLNIGSGVSQDPVFQANIFTTAPGFVNEAAHDYRLAAGSKLIDVGNPAALATGEPQVDIRGLPRLRDGNYDGTARRDMGAYEFQPAIYS